MPVSPPLHYIKKDVQLLQRWQCLMLTCLSSMQNFIKKYVQCYNCGNPETVVKIRKENIYLKCKACGAVSDVDMRHRLNTYILKNPPEEKVSKAEKKCERCLHPFPCMSLPPYVVRRRNVSRLCTCRQELVLFNKLML